jgi:hypothetical protein
MLRLVHTTKFHFRFACDVVLARPRSFAIEKEERKLQPARQECQEAGGRRRFSCIGADAWLALSPLPVCLSVCLSHVWCSVSPVSLFQQETTNPCGLWQPLRWNEYPVPPALISFQASVHESASSSSTCYISTTTCMVRPWLFFIFYFCIRCFNPKAKAKNLPGTAGKCSPEEPFAAGFRLRTVWAKAQVIDSGRSYAAHICQMQFIYLWRTRLRTECILSA